MLSSFFLLKPSEPLASRKESNMRDRQGLPEKIPMALDPQLHFCSFVILPGNLWGIWNHRRNNVRLIASVCSPLCPESWHPRSSCHVTADEEKPHTNQPVGAYKQNYSLVCLPLWQQQVVVMIIFTNVHFLKKRDHSCVDEHLHQKEASTLVNACENSSSECKWERQEKSLNLPDWHLNECLFHW